MATESDWIQNFGEHVYEVGVSGVVQDLSISTLAEWARRRGGSETPFYSALRQELIAAGVDYLRLVERDGNSKMGVVVNLDAITEFQKAQRLSFVDEQDVQQNQGEQEMTPQEALQYNVDAAQHELDRRHAEGEDVSGLRVCERTAVIKMTDARLAREALWLMQGGDGRVVLAHADVVDGKVQTRAGRDDVMGLPVEAIHARERRLAKLAEEFLAVPAGGPAVPPTWDLMKIASANEQQADAMKMVESLAERRGAQVSAWEQSAAKEWKLATATEGRRFFRVGVSTGGVVNVNGDPYTPHERRLNVTLGALQESWVHAVAMTVELAASIKMDVVGADLPADQASAWRRLSEEENRLAGYLTSYEHGTALLDAEGATAWYLQEQDGATVLIHAAVRAGRVDDVGASRFEAVEMGADVESLEGYTTKVKSTADSWVIDPNLVSTMKVGDNEQAHSLSGPR